MSLDCPLISLTKKGNHCMLEKIGVDHDVVELQSCSTISRKLLLPNRIQLYPFRISSGVGGTFSSGVRSHVESIPRLVELANFSSTTVVKSNSSRLGRKLCNLYWERGDLP
jgi:hypothetical protein